MWNSSQILHMKHSFLKHSFTLKLYLIFWSQLIVLTFLMASRVFLFLVQWEQLRFAVVLSCFWALPPLPVVLLHPRHDLPLPARHDRPVLENLKSRHQAFTHPRETHPLNSTKVHMGELKIAAPCYRILRDENKSPRRVLKYRTDAAIISFSLS